MEALMSRRRLSVVFSLILLSATLVLAAQTGGPDLTGIWTGTFTTSDPPDEDPAHFVLKQAGAELTGTGGPSAERQYPIAKGKVVTAKEGTTTTFEVAAEGTVMHFELRLAEGRLHGTATAERDGRTLTAAVDVRRTK
jgi:hypothetical protein